jgi:hypothetical protein
MTRLFALGGPLLAIVLLGSCDNLYLLRGTLNGDCDPPRYTSTDGGADTATLRKSNCQPMGAVCCRRNAKVARTSCQYPEDCYVAPFMGACATPVDCADTQTCDNAVCQCERGGPPCVDPNTKIVSCCAADESCVMGKCTQNATVPDGGA